MTGTTPTTGLFERVEVAAEALGRRVGRLPPTAIVLGSGLGGFAERLDQPVAVPYGDVPGWPKPTVSGHAGRLVIGRVGDVPVAVLAGRVHAYEGYPPHDVTFATRVIARAGIRHLILTNAAGGINASFGPASLMVIDDHINLMGFNPLVGPNDPRLGPRFPDMTEVYSRRLRGLADEAARATGVAVAHGVYLAVSGPSYETPAEIRAFRTLGADAVGMSTVPEALVARHMNVEVLGLSCIANPAAGLTDAVLNEQDVLETAGSVASSFSRLLEAIVARI